jgi:hypothetical protein
MTVLGFGCVILNRYCERNAAIQNGSIQELDCFVVILLAIIALRFMRMSLYRHGKTRRAAKQLVLAIHAFKPQHFEALLRRGYPQ